MADPVVSLASLADMKVGAFADLVSAYPDAATQAALNEGTRIIEGICDRRLAPFTGLAETCRVAALKPDEAARPGTGGAPSPWSSMGPTPAFPTAAGNWALWPVPAANVDWQLVRHVWLKEHPPRYQEMWTPYMVASIVTRGGAAPGSVISTILDGPGEDGHVWFLPPGNLLAGSRVLVTYGGGYSTIPAELVRANKYIAASVIVRELNPDDVQHDPDALYNSGLNVLAQGNWIRGHPAPGLRVLP